MVRLNDLKSRGVDAIVDLTVVGLGRFIRRIAKVAQLTRLNIIFATGIYTYRDAPLFCRLRVPTPGAEDIMTQMFIHDIEKGVSDTGLRAGILKCATDEHGVTKDVDEFFGPSRRRIAKPACRFPHTRLHPEESVWISSESSVRKVLTLGAS